MRTTVLVTLPASSSLSPAANYSIPRPFLPIHGKILLDLEREKTKGILLCSCGRFFAGHASGPWGSCPVWVTGQGEGDEVKGVDWGNVPVTKAPWGSE